MIIWKKENIKEYQILLTEYRELLKKENTGINEENRRILEEKNESMQKKRCLDMELYYKKTYNKIWKNYLKS